jgi:hypothetical protein
VWGKNNKVIMQTFTSMFSIIERGKVSQNYFTFAIFSHRSNTIPQTPLYFLYNSDVLLLLLPFQLLDLKNESHFYCGWRGVFLKKKKKKKKDNITNINC